MAGTKEIRSKIKSVQNTRKITKAMEMVAASKMKKAQDRMRATRPYVQKIMQIAGHLAHANPEFKHPFLTRRETVKNVGLIVVTSDKGLAGGLNTNVLRAALIKIKEWQAAGVGVRITAIGNKGLGFMQRFGINVVSHVTHLGDRPHIDQLIGPLKVLTDAYIAGEIDAIHIVSTRFVNTMKQDPLLEQVVPLAGDKYPVAIASAWDYIYEPDPKEVLSGLLERYGEAIIFQAVVENMASEQSARMVAMKAASDNAGTIIDELQLIYNKTRQAAITKEISEIVGGAAAVS
jgi:F-type H+-transporting ATPase subunit gamma